MAGDILISDHPGAESNDSFICIVTPRGRNGSFMVDLSELIEVRSVGFFAGVIVGQEADELEHSLGEGDEPLAPFFDNSQGGLCQI